VELLHNCEDSSDPLRAILNSLETRIFMDKNENKKRINLTLI
jgi:hypothetical protein